MQNIKLTQLQLESKTNKKKKQTNKHKQTHMKQKK
jgi:hypothetical protein